MNNLYIDYISHFKLSKREDNKVSGANTGTDEILLQILESNYPCENVYIIAPKKYKAATESENLIINNKRFKKILANDLYEVNYLPNSTLFIPMVCGKEMIMVEKLKKIHPELKIYGRVHDKNHNFPLDLFDRYYYSGIKSNSIWVAYRYFGKKILFKFKYSSWIKNFDKVFTVSNYSMQKLEDSNIKFINYYYQGAKDIYDDDEETTPENYILFVNGSRPEKNFLRTLIAFLKYKDIHEEDSVKLIVTGVDETTKNNILKYIEHKSDLTLKDVEFMNYVSYDELHSLYKKCQFLIFASKGEGFGLPVLEAIMCNRPVLASWSTSIPEVAGSSVRYFNPFNIDSIINGIEYMRIESNMKYYEKAVHNRKKIIKEIIREDNKNFLRELFN